MSVLRRMMRVSNRSLLAFIFFFSLSSSCLYFIYVAPGIGEYQDTPSPPPSPPRNAGCLRTATSVVAELGSLGLAEGM